MINGLPMNHSVKQFILSLLEPRGGIWSDSNIAGYSTWGRHCFEQILLAGETVYIHTDPTNGVYEQDESDMYEGVYVQVDLAVYEPLITACRC